MIDDYCEKARERWMNYINRTFKEKNRTKVIKINIYIIENSKCCIEFYRTEIIWHAKRIRINLINWFICKNKKIILRMGNE